MADLQRPTSNVPLDYVMQAGLVGRALTPLDKNGYTRDESYTVWIIDLLSLLIPGLTKGLSELDARYSPSSYALLDSVYRLSSSLERDHSPSKRCLGELLIRCFWRHGQPYRQHLYE